MRRALPALLFVLLSTAWGCGGAQRPSALPFERASESLGPSPVAGATLGAGPADLEGLLRQARREHPALRAALQRWRAAREEAPQVGGLPDGRIAVGLNVLPLAGGAGGLQPSLGIQQGLPLSAELQQRERLAWARAAVAGAGLRARWVSLEAAARRAWWERVYLARALRLRAEGLALLGQMATAAQARYAAGMGRQQAVLRLQLEVARQEDELRRLGDLRGPLDARLNQALGRDPAAPLPWPPSEAAPPALPLAPEADRAAALQQDNPELQRQRLETAVAAEGLALAQREGLPELGLGLTWTRMAKPGGGALDGQDALLASFSVGLPWDRARYRAGITAAEAGLAAARQEERGLQQQLEADLSEATYRVADAARRLEVLRQGLLPKARQVLEGVLQAFGAGELDLLDALDAQRSLLELELAAARAEVDGAQAQADLDRLLGRSRIEAPWVGDEGAP